MLFQVRMTVKLPTDMPVEKVNKLKADEKELAQHLQRKGIWRHLWRIAGLYANVSIFDVPDNQALHDTLMQLPLYPSWRSKSQPCADIHLRSTPTTAEFIQPATRKSTKTMN